MTEHEKYVDEAWKDSVTQEKETRKGDSASDSSPVSGEASAPSSSEDLAQEDETQDVELNFVNYITSLIFQAMIFLGEVPNPMNENTIEKNPQQAKFLIDTLILLRDKTKGNLTAQEDNILNSSIYELQMKYVECMKQQDGV